MISWWGLLAPAGTPAPIIDRLNAQVVKSLQLPDVRERLAGLGVEAVSSTPAEMSAAIRSDIAVFSAVIKSANIKAD